MDENELRIAPIEKVILALALWIVGTALEDAAATIRAEMCTASAQEREACAQTLQLLTGGRRRFAPPAMGLYLKDAS